MGFQKFQDILALVDKIDRADREFGQDLWLIAERIVLQRLTKTQEKGLALRLLARELKEIIGHPKETTLGTPEKFSELDEFEGQNSDTVQLSRAFSVIVDSLEKMDSDQMYRVIDWLRVETTPAASQP
ncbi:MAG: hypothetical protein ACREBS_04375 [Nitrososphaerales archaeon]